MEDSPFETRFQIGKVVEATAFEAARKPSMAKLTINTGERTLQSAAQTGYNYNPDDLVGRNVLCATDLGTVTIAGYESEALTVGVPDENGHPVLVTPDDDVPLGGELY